ncbi:MAG: hypothetical protein JXQ81_11705 [Desulfuromonadales bacterium]|nr:hypothetical protein [Desulfuromonadales bacterium]MBN2793165.1 hypothetical protein [Desulfuromonadales bacterium]
MNLIDRLEQAIEKLIRQNILLKETNERLLQEKTAWSNERDQLVGDIDRMLERIESLRSEGP